MSDPWGLQQPPIHIGTQALSPRLARLAEVQATGIALTQQDPHADDFPTADELLEDQTMQEGWCPLDKAPRYCLLPAAWPIEHRAWVPDRLPRIAMSGSTDSYWNEIFAVPDDEWHDDHPAGRARAAGLPDPPADHVCLLRSPCRASRCRSCFTTSCGQASHVATGTTSFRSIASRAMC